jgi:hypothetical protein
VVNKYNLKFRKLDILFASDFVGDGSNDIIGPFQTAQTQFYCKGIILLCIRGYREINQVFNKVLQQLAREAAAGHDGLQSQYLSTQTKRGSLSNNATTFQGGYNSYGSKWTWKSHPKLATLFLCESKKSTQCKQILSQ